MLLTYCKNLKKIRIYEAFLPLDTSYHLKKIFLFKFNNLKNITHFEICNVESIDVNKLSYMISHIKNLQKFYIDDAYLGNDLFKVLKKYKNLNNIFINSQKNTISLKLIIKAFNNLPNLNEIKYNTKYCTHTITRN